MSEKGVLPSRSFSCLIAVSMLFLIVSSSILFRFGDRSFVPRSIYKSILINSTSTYFIPNDSSVQIEPLSHSFVPSPNSCKHLDSNCLNSNASKLDASEPHQRKPCDQSRALLKVYMYNLPPEFHFGLLGWRGNSVNQAWPYVGDINQIPPYPGGLNLQHSPEYWLTLDLLSSTTLNVPRPCSAVLVQNSNQADIIFVPFFSSLSYNRHSKINGKEKISVNSMLQDKLVEYLKRQPEWKRFGGKDHLIVAHHPNSLLVARKKLGSAMFVLADFGRYPVHIANIDKDVIAPYKHIVRTVSAESSPPFEERAILLYFQGAIYRKDGGAIRQELYYLLKDEKDVHFTFGTVRGNGVHKASRGMASSKFCVNIAGDTPSSNRLFDSIASHCVPVIISDEIELPYEDVLDYSEFCIFVRASDAVKEGCLLNLLRGIEQDKWTKMWERLKKIVPHFEYQYPSKPGDAVDMIWQAVSRKISSVQHKVHRKNRYQMSQHLSKAH